MTVRFDILTRAVRTRTPMLVIAAAAMLALSSTGCEAKVSGAPEARCR
jgi:hypothetical protein